jgi:hypothetical protein
MGFWTWLVEKHISTYHVGEQDHNSLEENSSYHFLTWVDVEWWIMSLSSEIRLCAASKIWAPSSLWERKERLVQNKQT